MGRPVCSCGHPFVAHHGDGPCIAVISTAQKKTKEPEGRAGYGSVCSCQKYNERTP